MTRLHLRDVLDSTGAKLLGAVPRAEGLELVGVSTDTRSLREGELYVALSGPNFDGNRFVRQAFEAGARAAILRDDAGLDHGSLPDGAICLHDEPRRALADLASWYRSTLDATVLGITGSCGKTTTKNLVRELMSAAMPVVASPSSFNNDIGVPHTLLLAEPDTELVVVELGTNHPGEIAQLCRIARPDAGIITNIGAAHLEGLGSLDGVAREKGDLAAALPESGFLVLNADCPFTPEIRSRTGTRVITFSVDGNASEGPPGDLNAREVFFHSGGTTFQLGEHEITSPLLGIHNVQNLLAALAVCEGLGIPLETVLPAIPSVSEARHRMERLQVGSWTVLDDTYNANPDALRAAVRVLCGFHGHPRRVLVLGDMLELGDLAAEMHHSIGREAAQGGIDVLVCVGELSQAAAAGAREAGLERSAVLHVADTAEAVERVPRILEDGDVVLVKGSRGMELERVVERLVSMTEGR